MTARPRHAPHPGEAARGFTLIEVLLALALFSTVIVLLLSSFTGAERARDLLSGSSRATRQIRTSLDRIGSDLQGAFAADGIEETSLTCREDTFSGKPASTLTFASFSVPEAGGRRPASDVVKVRYHARVGPDGTFIELYREQSDLPLIENRIPTRDVRLADRLLGFRVELFDGGKWVKEWPAGGAKKTSLPRKVAFVLTDAVGKEYRRVVAVPLAGQEASIAFSGKRGGERR